MCYRTSFLFLGCGHTVQSTEAIPNAPPCPTKSGLRKREPESFATDIRSSHDRIEQIRPSLEQLEAVSLTWHGRNRILAMPQTAALRTPSPSDMGTSQNRTPNSGCSIHSQSMGKTSPQSNDERRQTSRRSSMLLCDAQTSHPLHTFRVNALCKRCEIHRQRKIAIFEVKMIAESVERSLGRYSPTRTDGTTPTRTPSRNGASRMSMVSIAGERTKRRRVIEGPLKGGENGQQKKRGMIPFRAGTDWSNSRSHPIESQAEGQTATLRIKSIDSRVELKLEIELDKVQQQATPPPEAPVDPQTVVQVANAPDPASTRDTLGRNARGMERIMGWAGFQ